MNNTNNDPLSRRKWLGLATTASVGSALLGTASPALGAGTRQGESAGTGQGARQSKDIGVHIYNIREFGAKGDGSTLDTAAVQAAIDACNKDQGGTVLVPAGRFVIGTVELKSNVTLHIAAQGVLLGSADGKQYHAADAIPLSGDTTLNDGNVGLLFAVQAENITIEGQGTIDGQGAQFRSPSKGVLPPAGITGNHRPYHLLFHQCRNLTVRDIFLLKSAYHSIRVIQCEFVKMEGLHIHNRVVHNNDGFHFISSRYVHISNCDIQCQDDACALFGSCQFITVTNCSFSTRWSVFRFGGGVAENITVSNCLIYETYGCPIKMRCGPGSRFENISFSNIVMKDVTGPISMGLGPQRSQAEPTPETPGILRNISFSGIHATVVKPVQLRDTEFTSNYNPGEIFSCIVLNGMGEGYMENISFNDVHVQFPGGGTAEQAGVRDVPKIAGEYFQLGVLPAYGLYARNVKALTLHNVRLTMASPDYRPAVIFDHVEDAAVNGLSVQGVKTSESLFRFIESRDVLLTAVRVLTPTDTFLQLEGAGCGNIKIDGGDLSKAASPLAFISGASRDAVRMLMLLLVLIITFATGPVKGQTAGDEEKEMLTKGQQRDRQAADEALKGWWPVSMKDHDQRLSWWREARFGMFIHWGVYSRAGGEWKGHKVEGYAEHLMRKEKVSRQEYLELAHGFNPIKFNAEEWVLHAKQAGMRYMIITSKHHDGFAMYDSKVSDFNIMQQTAWKKDPMAALSAACKKYGVKFGFYYSHAFDWEYPDAPGNDWEYNNPAGDKGLFGGLHWYDLHPELLPKAQRYVDTKAIPQIKELIRKYHPDIFWFDTPSKLPFSENLRILQAIRAIDLHVVVNGRLARDGDNNFGDYKNTADRPAEFYPVTGDWEAIPTTNESYGYHKFDSSHKPPAHFIQLLAKAVSRGGNLLMNVGPKGDGTFDTRDLHILQGIGKWMDINGESIHGATAGPLPFQNWGVSTLKGTRLYLHVFSWPADGKLYVGGLNGPTGNIYLLSDVRKTLLKSSLAGKDLIINIPLRAPDTANTVIVVEVEKMRAQQDSVQYSAPNIALTRLLAFDAQLHGKGFSFGDGKADRFYVDGWSSKDQYLSWNFRTAETATYRMTITYRAGEGYGGTYQWQADGYRGEHKIDIGGGDNVVTADLGIVTLNAGTHELSIRPLDIAGRQLMRPLEVRLVRTRE